MRARRFKDPEKRGVALEQRQNTLSQTVEIALNMKEGLQVHGFQIYDEEVTQTIMAAMNDFTNKAEYGEYMLWMSNVCQKLFKETQKILQQMKVIKRN